MISFVVPAFDEEASIVATIRDLQRVSASQGYENSEIIVVDDGSSDQTAKLALEAGARIVRHPHNLGYGKSLKDGIAQAKNDLILILDADGTYPVDSIPNLVEEMAKGFDMVVGARDWTRFRESLTKRLLRYALKRLVEWSAGRKIADVNSGFRIFRKADASEFFDQLCDTFSFSTSLTLAYAMNSKFIAHLPITYTDRVGVSKVRLQKDILRTLTYICQSILYYNPLKIFGLFATLTFILSLVSFSGGVVWQLRTAFVLGVGGLLVTLIVFSLGLLADLLKQIMLK